MPLSHQTLLSPEARARLAADPDLGGGTLLQSALAASQHPDQLFIRSGRPLINAQGEEQSEFSLLQLDCLVHSWSVWYRDQGVRPRDRVAIYIEDSFAYWVHLYALAQLGAIPVLVNSNASPAVAAALCRQTSPVGLYAESTRLRSLGDAVRTLPDLRWTELADELPAPPPARLPDGARFRHAGQDPVAIMHSSGTTGLVKAVVHTHASIVAGPRYRLRNFLERPDTLMMPAQPQSHLGFIVYGTYAVLAGVPLVPLYDPSGHELARAIETHRPTTVMAFAHAYAELAALEVPEGALDSVTGWITMGDAIHEAHIKAILGKRSPDLPPAVFFDRFGTTELGWGLIVQPRTLASKRNDRCVGKPDPVAEVAVLRKDGSLADAGEIGLFGAKGPTITAGYWNDSDTTYRSLLGGYWLTGDVVFRDEEGNYFQVDRTADVIDTPNGPGYSVLMEEVLLSEVPEIVDCAVVAGSHEDHALPVAIVNSDADPARLLEAANEALRAAGHPELVLLEVATSEAPIPVGVTGKVLKRRLRERYSCLGELAADNGGAPIAFAAPLVHVAPTPVS